MFIFRFRIRRSGPFPTPAAGYALESNKGRADRQSLPNCQPDGRKNARHRVVVRPFVTRRRAVPAGIFVLLVAKGNKRSLRQLFFAAFWSAVNRGLRPQRIMYFLTAKSTKNSPADAFACFVPSNVRNGRLFAGAHAPLPRFLPLLAGPSFHGSGIEPESCAANGGVREGATTGSETQHPAIASGSGFKPPHYRLQRKKNGAKAER